VSASCSLSASLIIYHRDGDFYNVIWDPDLQVPTQRPPMGYKPAIPRKVDHVTMDHVKEFFIGTVSLISRSVDTIPPLFIDYIKSDVKGMIYNAHTAHADRNIHSDECLELAQLASVAVDFMKSGAPVTFSMNGRLQPSRWPDYMEKPKTYESYESIHVLGWMFRYITPTPAYEECELSCKLPHI